jgi:hypothetical protein
MKKISVWFLILVFVASLAQAQDTATQQQLDKLSGQLQDLLDAQAQQGKRIDALEKELSDLRDKVNTPVANDFATRDQLGKITDQINEVDKRRKEDSEMIAKQIENLAHAAAVAPVPTPTHHTSSRPTATPPDGSGTGSGTGSDTATTSTPSNGYYYEVKKGDQLGLIVKAYRDKGVKVTTAQVLNANPGLDPNKLFVGKKIFIPDASAK